MGEPSRIDVGECALGLLDVPYLWGGKDGNGIDCSGVVTYSLWIGGGPDLRQSHNAQRLFDSLPVVSVPSSFDLAFWKAADGHISHVMLWLGGLVYGACGGDQHCTTVEIARQLGARVRLRPGVGYRSGFAGFRRLPVND